MLIEERCIFEDGEYWGQPMGLVFWRWLDWKTIDAGCRGEGDIMAMMNSSGQ